MVSFDVIQWSIDDIEAKINKYQQAKKSPPEDLTEKRDQMSEISYMISYLFFQLEKIHIFYKNKNEN